MKINMLHPLISCICITSYRPELLIKSIIMFAQQNYPNLELIISYPVEDNQSKNIIKQVVASMSIRIVEIARESSVSIGKARNDAFVQSNGDFLAIWDDDDIYQYNRIADQYNLLNGNGRYFHASILNQIVLYDELEGKAYQSFSNIWSGTLLCKREYLLKYPCENKNQFEMEPVIDFLQEYKLLLTDIFNPALYINVYHGNNELDHLHFKYYLKYSFPLPEEITQSIKNYFRQKVQIMYES